MEGVVGCLKELLPLDLRKTLMGLKGCAFWGLVAEVSLPLHDGPHRGLALMWLSMLLFDVAVGCVVLGIAFDIVTGLCTELF